MLYAIPAYLHDELSKRLDARIAEHPGAATDRDFLFGQLVDHVAKTGTIPDFSLTPLAEG